MYCPWCGKPQDDSAAYCSSCGGRLSESEALDGDSDGASLRQLASEVSGATEKKAFTALKNPKLLVAVVAVAAVVLLVFFLLRPLSPRDAAEKFMKCMSSGNYAKAYEMLYQTDSLMLSKEKFVQVQENLEKELGPIAEFRIDFRDEERRIEQGVSALIGETEYLPSKRQDYLVTYRRSKMGQPEELILSMRNASAGKRPIWRVCVDDWYDSYSLQIPAIKGCTVLADGKQVALVDGKVSFHVFAGDRIEVTVSGPYIKPTKVVLDSSQHSMGFETLPVSDSLQSQLEKVIDGFNKADIAVGMDWNVDHYKPYVKQTEGAGSFWFADSLWEQLVEKTQMMKEDGKKADLTLIDVIYDRAELVADNKVKMRVEETWESKIYDSSGTVVEEYEPHTIVWIYELERQPNGRWLIVDHE